MSSHRPIRIRKRRVAALLAAVAAVAVVAGDQPPSTGSINSTTTAAPIVIPREAPSRPRRASNPAQANLDPALRRALRRATADAIANGVKLRIVSGWRSPAHQQRLLHEAVSKYGSLDEAARWVATPETSAHVSGDAVDVGPSAAAVWLSQHGAAYGLCQIYGNEPWHFELRPQAVEQGCPPMYPDPTRDPRMQR